MCETISWPKFQSNWEKDIIGSTSQGHMSGGCFDKSTKYWLEKNRCTKNEGYTDKYSFYKQNMMSALYIEIESKLNSE